MTSLLAAMEAAFFAPGFAALAAACLLAGVVRGFSGFGTSLIFMPVATIFIPGAEAIAALLIFDAFGGLMLLPAAARACDRAEVGLMALGFAMGVPAGAAMLASLDPVALRWLVAAMALGAGLALAAGVKLPQGLPRWMATPAGAMSGLFAGVSGLGGVPVVLWNLARAVEPAKMRATVITFFMIGTCFTAVTLFGSGLAGIRAVALGLILGPLFLVGTLAGRALFPLAPEHLFRRLAFGLIFAAAGTGLPIWD